MTSAGTRPLVALDTSVASLFLRPSADAGRYVELLLGYRLALPIVAYAEIEQGALIGGWGEINRNRMAEFLSDVRLLPLTKTTAAHWAALRFECRRRGIGNTDNDAWIAAAALETNLPLVSNDRIHLRMRDAVPQLQVLSLLDA